MRPKVIVIQKSFANYRKGIFDKLNECYNFKLLHSNSDNGLHEIKTSYSEHIGKLKYAKKDTAVYLKCFKQVLSFRPHVVVHEFTPSIVSIFPVLLLCKYLKIKFILWGHGYNQSNSLNERSIQFRVREWLLQQADATIFYDEANRKKVHQLIPSKKYFVANNALDTEQFLELKREFDLQGKEKIKRELNIHYDHVLIFVGRLLEQKILTNCFIQIVTQITSSNNDIGIIVIGDGPEYENIKKKITDSKLDNIHLLGAIYEQTVVSKYLYASDLLLMPGYVGLAVNHALSFECPVVTFEKGKNGPFHSPEIIYLDNYETGYKAKNFDIEDLAKFIIRYLDDETLRDQMKKAIEKKVQDECSIERMKRGFTDAINYSLRND